MGASSSCNGRPYVLLKLLFGVIVVVGFSWFLLFGVLESGARKTMKAAQVHAKHMDLRGREKLANPELDLNYMSKRRVPNGPNPIHNRRSGNSGEPPRHGRPG